MSQGDLERLIEAFVTYYNHHRYHESLGNLTPADVYFGRDKAIIEKRRWIKEDTMNKRRLAHRRQAAQHQAMSARSSVTRPIAPSHLS